MRVINILIVEDEKPISNLMKLSLKRAGYGCTCVYNGADAADMLDRRGFDLVLLDVMLPEVDGFTLMEYIRPKGIPVIFITAKSSVGDRVKGLRMGAEDYIVKPFEMVTLLVRIEKVLERFGRLNRIYRFDDIVPVWDFYGSVTAHTEDENYKQYVYEGPRYETLLSINAIDGTLIDRELGY